MKELRILGVMITNRMTEAVKVQSILSKYGCQIKTRLGLHEATDMKCSMTGFLMLELSGDSSQWDPLEQELAAIPGLVVRKMSFDISE